jgi:transcriptional regulator of arginine metabolism
LAASATAAARRTLLRLLLEQGTASTQEELLLALERRGVHASQPVLSRDLRALGAVKAAGAYSLPAEPRVTPLDALRPLLRGCRASGTHLIVVHCEPGAASSLARALEAEHLDGIAGTIAGDDTIFVAVSSKEAGRRVQRRIQSLL